MIDFKRENDDDQPLPNTEYPHNTCVVTDDICVTPVSMRDDGEFNIHHSVKVNVAQGTLIVPVAHERGRDSSLISTRNEVTASRFGLES